jgi:hypothetical protein
VGLLESGPPAARCLRLHHWRITPVTSASGCSAASAPPKPKHGSTSPTTNIATHRSTVSDSPVPATPPPSPNSSTASMPPAPSTPSKNHGAPPQPAPRDPSPGPNRPVPGVRSDSLAWPELRQFPHFHVAHTGSRAHRAIVSGGAREYDLSESDSKSLALSCSQREYSRE